MRVNDLNGLLHRMHENVFYVSRVISHDGHAIELLLYGLARHIHLNVIVSAICRASLILKLNHVLVVAVEVAGKVRGELSIGPYG